MFTWMLDPHAWVGFLTLTALEIVLGIDNIVFLSLVTSRLPASQRDKARRLGLILAMGMRLLLLASISWVMSLTEPLFEVLGRGISGRDIILLVGGLFLLAKATMEIHHEMENSHSETAPRASNFPAAIVQIVLLDIIFSLDSVITAVGLVEHLPIMMLAVIASVGLMLFAAKPIGEFVTAHPSFKMLAMAFLLLVGFTLVGEGAGVHVPKGYIYFAMAFSLGVELLNLRRVQRVQADR
ncbi:TerC family protein [Desulfovibrio subterraneus]|uniref:TerC family protein n=1 Tax=Desulfovibrio subterraneus TaxID=2718620 RepID=UPI0022B8E1F9|nr:TerC family protein [Desulfovibrio subterraneus]WBF68655.1 TerC family protein [Desulfovibrio subterraneus]